MTRRSPAARRSIYGVVAVVLSCLGCSSTDAPPPEQPEASSSGSAATDEGVVTEEGESLVTSYGGVPPGFPVEEVPLADEDLVTSGSVSEYDDITAYTVVVESEQSPVETLEGALGRLEDAGLEGDTEVPGADADPIPLTLFGDGRDTVVVLSYVGRGTGTLLTYTVEVS